MQRIFLRKLAIAGVTILLLGVSILSVVFIARARQNAPFVLTNQVAPLTSRARMVGPADAQQQLNLSVGLQLRNREELASLLSDLNNPRSPRYHHFLTSQEFTDLFGPTPAQVQQVKSYLQQQGLTVTSVSPNGLLIDATSSVAQAEAAFQVTINNYVLGANTFFANANPPTIPGALSSLITSIG
ncbi:MAG TPA: protease pro-enzyme activation domain-containing protein, partial [Ktedonobacteraceae bacterium]|nr:protease pro-enzyme activation domain-containing protein [Ktedonobacteraceae bacterium]